MTYRKPGKNAEREAEMRKPLPPPWYEQYGINLADPMPWWYPIMHFEAAVGRQVLRSAEVKDNAGD